MYHCMSVMYCKDIVVYDMYCIGVLRGGQGGLGPPPPA